MVLLFAAVINDVGAGAYGLAFLGGIISFVSPCVLPLVPAYISIASGGSNSRKVVVQSTALFVAGFTTVFMLLGLTASSFGQALGRNQSALIRISGLVIIAMGLFMILSLLLRSITMQREFRFHPALAKFGSAKPLVAGAAFGFGWTPCIGPILGSIYAIAATQTRVLSGAALLLIYGLGLGIPFLLTGLAVNKLGRVFGWFKRHHVIITTISALVLITLGFLLALNQLSRVTALFGDLLDLVGLTRLRTIG